MTRSPRSATHIAYGGYNNELFFSRRGRLVYEFSMSRHQWFLTKIKPDKLRNCKRLSVFDMHPDTAMEFLGLNDETVPRHFC